jgi:hypothetical protein
MTEEKQVDNNIVRVVENISKAETNPDGPNGTRDKDGNYVEFTDHN